VVHLSQHCQNENLGGQTIERSGLSELPAGLKPGVGGLSIDLPGGLGGREKKSPGGTLGKQIRWKRHCGRTRADYSRQIGKTGHVIRVPFIKRTGVEQNSEGGGGGKGLKEGEGCSTPGGGVSHLKTGW